ncbi:MAG: hypothetical protein ABSC71_03800 [Candidatus Acidiferrales bacterium]
MTEIAAGATMDTMTTETTTSKERRSSRIFTRIPVRASGKNTQGKKFRENSQTIVINAHGALLYLNEEIGMGNQLVLINPVTEEEQECRVVYLGELSDKGTRVGIEFLSPSPHFWGVDFAPQDWPAPSSSSPTH